MVLGRYNRLDSAGPSQCILHFDFCDYQTGLLRKKRGGIPHGAFLLVRPDQDVVGQLSLFLGLNLPTDHQRKLVGTDRFLGRSGNRGIGINDCSDDGVVVDNGARFTAGRDL